MACTSSRCPGTSSAPSRLDGGQCVSRPHPLLRGDGGGSLSSVEPPPTGSRAALNTGAGEVGRPASQDRTGSVGGPGQPGGPRPPGSAPRISVRCSHGGDDQIVLGGKWCSCAPAHPARSETSVVVVPAEADARPGSRRSPPATAPHGPRALPPGAPPGRGQRRWTITRQHAGSGTNSQACLFSVESGLPSVESRLLTHPWREVPTRSTDRLSSLRLGDMTTRADPGSRRHRPRRGGALDHRRPGAAAPSRCSHARWSRRAVSTTSCRGCCSSRAAPAAVRAAG